MNLRVYNALRKAASVGADDIITGGLAGLGAFGLAKAFGAGTGLATTIAVPAAVAGGYLRNRYNASKESEHSSAVSKAHLDGINDYIRTTARRLGIRNWDSKSDKELQSDIESVLNNGDGYHGNLLNENEMELVNDYLNDQQPIRKIIRDYHDYLTRIKVQKAIVLPKTDNDY